MHPILLSLLGMICLGCSSPLEQAKLLGTAEFSKEAWATASQEERGTMVFSFLSKHDYKTLTYQSVTELLGRPTGYYDYDTYPAYYVGPRSVESMYGKGYLLAFVTNNNNNVIDVKIIPEPKR
jgi:hypothetical protein